MGENSDLSWLEKTSYGVGALGFNLVSITVVQWAIYYYSPPSGSNLPQLIPLGIAGSAMLVGRVIDAISDPAIGHWSDIIRTRWGRRIPFLIFGAPPLLLSFLFIWYPPIASKSIWNFIYLATLISSFWLFFTVYVNPYMALIPQLAKDDDERVDLSIWMSVGNIIGIAAVGVGIPILISRFGYKIMGLIVAGLGLITLYTPTLGISEEERWKKGESGEARGLIFKDALKKTLKNKPFLIFLVAEFAYFSVWNTLLMISPYIVTVLMQQPESMVSAIMGVALLSTLISLPIVRKLSEKWGKKKLFLIALGLSAIDMPLFSMIGLYNIIPPLYLAIAASVLLGFPLAAFFAIENAIIGEIVDHDEEKTGHRREGMFSGIRGLITKAAIGFAVFSSAVIMEYFGYSVGNEFGIRLVGILLAVLSVIGFFVFRKYPLED